MNNIESSETFAGAALRSRILCVSDRPRKTWATAPISTVRLMDAVPATQAGRGVYAHAEQDRPPRREPR